MKKERMQFFLKVCTYAYEIMGETLIPDTEWDSLMRIYMPDKADTGMWIYSVPEGEQKLLALNARLLRLIRRAENVEYVHINMLFPIDS